MLFLLLLYLVVIIICIVVPVTAFHDEEISFNNLDDSFFIIFITSIMCVLIFILVLGLLELVLNWNVISIVSSTMVEIEPGVYIKQYYEIN